MSVAPEGCCAAHRWAQEGARRAWRSFMADDAVRCHAPAFLKGAPFYVLREFSTWTRFPFDGAVRLTVVGTNLRMALRRVEEHVHGLEELGLLKLERRRTHWSRGPATPSFTIVLPDCDDVAGLIPAEISGDENSGDDLGTENSGDHRSSTSPTLRTTLQERRDVISGSGLSPDDLAEQIDQALKSTKKLGQLPPAVRAAIEELGGPGACRALGAGLRPRVAKLLKAEAA